MPRHAPRRDRPVPPAAPPENDPDAPAESEYALRRARALAAKEEALARKAQRDEQIELGQLLPRDAVRAAVSDAIVRLRSRLELIAPTLAPQLAALDDEDQARVLLRDAIEQCLNDLAHAFSASANAPSARLLEPAA